jgi:hypothetical protein
MAVEFDSCDGALWHVTQENNFANVDPTVYSYKDRYTEPDELGYKYHVLTYKENDHNSAEILCAYIGDVKFFIDNQAKAGYNGMMVKDKSVPKKTIKSMFKAILVNWQFPNNTIKQLVKQV